MTDNSINLFRHRYPLNIYRLNFLKIKKPPNFSFSTITFFRSVLLKVWYPVTVREPSSAGTRIFSRKERNNIVRDLLASLAGPWHIEKNNTSDSLRSTALDDQHSRRVNVGSTFNVEPTFTLREC